MPEIVNKIIVILALVCTVFVFGKLFYQAIRNKYAKIKTVKAQVADKFKADQLTKIYGPVARVSQYYVVFQLADGKKSFRVSETSYCGYQIGERGTLKYKGDRLVDFR